MVGTIKDIAKRCQFQDFEILSWLMFKSSSYHLKSFIISCQDQDILFKDA